MRLHEGVPHLEPLVSDITVTSHGLSEQEAPGEIFSPAGRRDRLCSRPVHLSVHVSCVHII